MSGCIKDTYTYVCVYLYLYIYLSRIYSDTDVCHASVQTQKKNSIPVKSFWNCSYKLQQHTLKGYGRRAEKLCVNICY